jgi:hypothetical protein
MTFSDKVVYVIGKTYSMNVNDFGALNLELKDDFLSLPTSINGHEDAQKYQLFGEK